jgi:hypothetical protein
MMNDHEVVILLRLARRVAVKFAVYETPPRGSEHWRAEFGDLADAIPKLDLAIEFLSAPLGASAQNGR